MVVMLEPDDIQALGEILKYVNEIEGEAIQEYVEQVGNITERLILDEYESADVGIEQLNSAVEQLQIAVQEKEQVSDQQLKEKSEQTDTEDVTMDSSDTNGHIVMEETQKEEENGQTVSREEAAPTEKDDELKTESEPEPQDNDQERTDEEELARQVEEDLDEELDDSVHDYFEERDDPELITQTLKEDPELVQGFIEESEENLQMIENGLIELEAAPEDLSLVDTIFRPFHTLKGVAGFLNLSDVNALAHSYENLLDDARKGELEFNEDIAEAVFEGIDALRVMVGSLAESKKKEEYVPHGLDLEYFADMIAAVRNNESFGSDRKTGSSTDSQSKDGSTKTKASKKEKGGQQRSFDPSDASKALGNIESSVRVSTGKMDTLLDLVGELVVTQNMVMQNEEIQRSGNKRLQQDIGQLKRITTNLQDLSMSLRMVPIKDTFQKMHRIVRDLSRKSGKKIVLEINGEDTEIDRNMVDELYEPLVHMIRNNCDHGLETPEERRMAGKPETGKIALNAYYKGGLVVIEVSDDGRGIDAEKIRQRAINKGVISEEEELSESQILNLIFTSGFSTRDDITDVSGRGVGMDVVQKVIERLRGSIEIKTKKGKGTTFSLRLPLTLAIIDGVVVRIGDERYIIPTTAIKESLVAPEGSYNKIAGKGETVFLRDRVVPLLRVDKIFDIDNAVQDVTDGILFVVENDNREAALLVDEMMDKQEIVIKSLGEGLNKIKGLAGGAIMSDGSVGLIIDVPTLLPKSKMSFKSGSG
ncbi:MAG: chemotaxis protein CheA [Bacteroidota bacterium]